MQLKIIFFVRTLISNNNNIFYDFDEFKKSKNFPSLLKSSISSVSHQMTLHLLSKKFILYLLNIRVFGRQSDHFRKILNSPTNFIPPFRRTKNFNNPGNQFSNSPLIPDITRRKFLIHFFIKNIIKNAKKAKTNKIREILETTTFREKKPQLERGPEKEEICEEQKVSFYVWTYF